MTRHEFLAALHFLLKPKTYLEIGVQHGWSLDLADASDVAYGIDPQPLVTPRGNQIIYSMTSDEFFNVATPSIPGPIDLAFIDGMHLFEYALRDYLNVEKHLSLGGLVVFDDVLPRNQEEASRVQCPGDWTGDVWKVAYILRASLGEETIRLVNTQPTGLLLVRGDWPSPDMKPVDYEEAVTVFGRDYMDQVPNSVLNRAYALDPQEALDWVRDGMV
jgi:hypothetical protein